MIRNPRIKDKVFALQSEGTIAKIVSKETIRIDWQGIGELDMPRSLLSWDNTTKAWDIKQGREYV